MKVIKVIPIVVAVLFCFTAAVQAQDASVGTESSGDMPECYGMTAEEAATEPELPELVEPGLAGGDPGDPGDPGDTGDSGDAGDPGDTGDSGDTGGPGGSEGPVPGSDEETEMAYDIATEQILILDAKKAANAAAIAALEATLPAAEAANMAAVTAYLAAVEAFEIAKKDIDAEYAPLFATLAADHKIEWDAMEERFRRSPFSYTSDSIAAEREAMRWEHHDEMMEIEAARHVEIVAAAKLVKDARGHMEETRVSLERKQSSIDYLKGKNRDIQEEIDELNRSIGA
ncbi:MAG: hypothetical protein ISS34_05170 [Candidatus Omnitrophica bacterium]|nr:hypothetical protein [Candidatus Omnitrophota bacterium]